MIGIVSMTGGFEGDCWVEDTGNPVLADAERNGEANCSCEIEEENSDADAMRRGAVAAVET